MNQYQLLVEKHLKTTQSYEGGVVVKVDSLTLLERFLIMGSSGTFYASGADVTKTITAELREFLAVNPEAALDAVLRVAKDRLALRKDPAIYILAQLSMPSVPQPTRERAYRSLSIVCPTGTDLLHYLAFRYPQGPQGSRHSGMGFRKAIARWFTEHRNLPLQAVKYEQRDGWTLRDALRISKPTSVKDDEAFAFIVDKEKYQEKYEAPIRYGLFSGYLGLRSNPEDAPRLIRELRLPREAVPGPLLAHKEVWEALLPEMPGRALIRNLGKLSSLDLDKTKENQDLIVQRIGYAMNVLHPFEFLIGERMYAQGHGLKGKLTWKPNHFIIEYLRAMFPQAYKNLEVRPGKPLIALDTSGSMTSLVAGTPLQALEAAAALASVLAYQYPHAEFFAYSNGLTKMDPRNHGADAFIQEMKRLSHVGTYCYLPLRYVIENPGQEYTAVISVTDSETADGGQRYSYFGREAMPATIPKCAELTRTIQRTQRRNFKHGVVAMATNDVSIADPRDPNQLDFVGLSADLPKGIDIFLGQP
jgi:60 kDa SS-A/Ro ribonucleoprotein